MLALALEEADRLALDATLVREIVTRHQRYTAATTEACVGAPADRHAARTLATTDLCLALARALRPLISAHVALEGLIALRPDSRPTAIVDTLRRAIRQLTDQSVGGLRCGLSVVGPASSARQLVTDASVALNATSSVEPVRWLAQMTALDYLVATSPPVIRRLVTGGSTALHTLDDRTDPTCRRVLDTRCEHQADLRAVAADLHCHPNTVLNLLRRIREIKRPDMNSSLLSGVRGSSRVGGGLVPLPAASRTP